MDVESVCNVYICRQIRKRKEENEEENENNFIK